MKKLILLLFILLLVQTAVFGQRKAAFYFHYNTDFGFSGSNSLCGPNPHYQLTLNFTSHTFDIYNYNSSELDGMSNHSETRNDSVSFFYNDPPLSYFHSFGLKKEVSGLFGGCNSGTCGVANTESITFNSCTTNDLSFKSLSCSISGQAGFAHISWSIAPAGLDTLLIQQGNTLLTDTKTTFNAPIGFIPAFYNWEYSIGGNLNVWTPFPSAYQGQSTVSVSAADLLGAANVYNFVNQNIRIRINPTSCSSQPGNTLTYVITKAPPNLSAVNATAPTCSDSNDGRVSFTFDRALVSGESLILNLFFNSNFTSSNQISEGNLDANNAYAWPDILAPGNYQLSYQNQFNGVQSAPIQSNIFTITAPSAVNFPAPTFTNVSCNNGSDGSISLTASGGVGNYQYMLNQSNNWQSFSSGSSTVINGLPAGNYNIEVRDGNQCLAKSGGNIIAQPVTITQPLQQLNVAVTAQTNPLAYGSSDGSFAATISGGTPYADGSYNYTLTNASGTVVNSNIAGTPNGGIYVLQATNLPAGDYTLSATDANYATANGNNNNGTNTGGCVATATFSLTQPPPLALTVTSQNTILCSGDATGSFTMTGSGGVPPYSYTWQLQNDPNGLVTQPDNAVSGVTSGTYLVNITDANGISLPNNLVFVLDQPAPVQVSIAQTDVWCYGGSDGTITLTASGGVGNYQYMIKVVGQPDTQWQPFSSANGQVITGLLNNSYYIEVRDGNQCLAKTGPQGNSNLFPVTINTPAAPLAVSVVAQLNPTGFGLSDGSITLDITGGTPNIADGSYNFTISSQAGNITSNITAGVVNGVYQVKIDKLPDGSYTLTANDANYASATDNAGCTAESPTIKLQQPPPLTAKIYTNNPILCSGDAASLIAHGSGGVPFLTDLPYIYTWKQKGANGTFNNLTNQTDSIATGLLAGTYSVNIQDANGIVLATDVVYLLSQPTPVQLDTAHTDNWCYGSSDGTITLNVSGGVGNYQYMITPPNGTSTAWLSFTTAANSQVIKNLAAGNYVISVRDGNQCLAQSPSGQVITGIPVVIAQPAKPLLTTLVSQTNPSGYGLSDGSITVLINGGTPKPDGSYNYTWTTLNGTPVTNNITTSQVANGYQVNLTNIPNGTYVITATDNNSTYTTNNGGCIYAATFNEVQPLPIKVKIELKDSVYCNGDAAGVLIAHVTGGVTFTTGLPYTYTWKKRNQSGSYIILSNQTDSIASGLVAGYYALNVSDANGIVLAKDSTFVISQPAPLLVSISNTNLTCSGVPDASAIANATGGTLPYTYSWNTGDNTDTIKNLSAGTYLVFITDAHGCQTQGNVVITQPDMIGLSVVKTNPTCNNSCDGKITITATGGNQPYTYKWLNSSNTSNTAVGLCSGYYSVIVTDVNGCSTSHQDTLTNPPALPLSIKPNRFICPNQTFAYDISVNQPNITYQWTSNNGFSSDSARVNLTQAGTYYAMVMNNNGCVSKDTLVLTAANATISNEFLVPTQAFNNEPIIVVNTSNPAPDSSKWVFPPQAVVSQNTTGSATFTIDSAGTYNIGLITYSGQCYDEQTQKVIVSVPANLNSVGPAPSPFIETFIVFPNPSSGTFTVQVQMQTAANIKLSLLNILSTTVLNIGQYSGSATYNIPVSYTLSPGNYILLLETPNGSRTYKIIAL